MSSWIRAVLVVSPLLVLGCGGAPPAPPATPATPAVAAAGAKPTVVAPGDAKIGDTTKCPISGEEFVVTASSPKLEYQGKTYYTCCAGCMKKLSADPAKHLAKPAS